MNTDKKYQCPECGKNHLEVLRVQAYEKVNIEKYPCVCNDQYPVAFERASVDCEEVVSHAWLEDDGTFEFHDSYVNHRDLDTQDWEVHCEDCSDSDEHNDAEPELEEESCKELPDKEKWSVRCARCRKEYEFAWTEPDRRGRIVVAGIDEFDPEKTFPESTVGAGGPTPVPESPESGSSLARDEQAM